MGKQQFAAGLADFNQAQLDTINAAVDDVQTTVQDLKNTDVANLSKMTPSNLKFADLEVVNAASNAWYTVLNVTGSGNIFRIIGRHVNDALNGAVDVEITLDGKTPVNLKAVGNMWSRVDEMNPSQRIVLQGNYRFTTSLLIRVSNRTGAAATIGAAVDYGLS